MRPFSTEFPVNSFDNKAVFVAEVIAWLRGTSYSNVFAVDSEQNRDLENAHLSSPDGEELRFRELQGERGWAAVGFRHDYPDQHGRVWRTEGVLKRAVEQGEQDLLRLRTQCFALTPGANLEDPRKPYLIKALLKEGRGGSDGSLIVRDHPHWLSETDLSVARAITLGTATTSLPVVYVSARSDGTWLLNKDELAKISYDLGGVAHVVVEPDRAFSFLLRDETSGSNAYGGTIGLSIPSRGVIRRYYMGWQIQDAVGLAKAIKAAALNVRGQMPAAGWDWTELQEQALRAQRERDRNRLTSAQVEELYEDEIDNLKEKVQQLEQELRASRTADVGTDEEEFSLENLVRRIGPEVYSGEISDRLRLAARTALDVADSRGLDARTRIVLKRLTDRLPSSPALAELLQDIERATKDPKRMAGHLTELLSRHGYKEKSEKKHVRLTARDGYEGLDAITISKTPSDHRGLKNQCKQVVRTLGLNKLTN